MLYDNLTKLSNLNKRHRIVIVIDYKTVLKITFFSESFYEASSSQVLII